MFSEQTIDRAVFFCLGAGFAMIVTALAFLH
jgi:hypothetical protein